MTRYNNLHTRGPLQIVHMERAKSSRNGNPAFFVTFDDGTRARTLPDAAWSYEAENSEFRDAPLMVTFTRGGQVVFASVVES